MPSIWKYFSSPKTEKFFFPTAEELQEELELLYDPDPEPELEQMAHIQEETVVEEKEPENPVSFAQLQAENEALAAQYAAGYDLEAVEQMALALGMVPKEQVEQVSISVSVPQEIVEEPGLWERIYTFLTGLLA